MLGLARQRERMHLGIAGRRPPLGVEGHRLVAAAAVGQPRDQAAEDVAAVLPGQFAQEGSRSRRESSSAIAATFMLKPVANISGRTISPPGSTLGAVEQGTNPGEIPGLVFPGDIQLDANGLHRRFYAPKMVFRPDANRPMPSTAVSFCNAP